jgi:molybdopterin synthase catalytic subunit
MERKPKNIFVQGPISSEKIAKSIQNHSTKTNIGAHSIFLGQVRADEKEGSTVTAIDYTTYEEMALQKAFEIREAIFENMTSPVCIFIIAWEKSKWEKFAFSFLPPLNTEKWQ